MSFFIWHLLHFICYNCEQPQLRYIPSRINSNIYIYFSCIYVRCPFGYAIPLTMCCTAANGNPRCCRRTRRTAGFSSQFFPFLCHSCDAQVWTQWSQNCLDLCCLGAYCFEGWWVVGVRVFSAGTRKYKKFFQLIFCYFFFSFPIARIPFICRFFLTSARGMRNWLKSIGFGGIKYLSDSRLIQTAWWH